MRRRGRRKRQHTQGATTSYADLTLAQAFARWDAMEKARTKLDIGIVDAYQRCAWVYASINMIASAIADTPQRVYPRGSDTPVSGTPLENLIIAPNRYPQQATSSAFRTKYMTHLLLDGGVVRLLVDMDGDQPRGMVAQPQSHFRAQTAIDTNGIEILTRLDHIKGSYSKGHIPGDTVHYDALPNPYSDWEGLSPLSSALISVNNEVHASDYVGRFFKNDASTGLILSTDNMHFSQKQAKEAQEEWDKYHAGVSKAFGTKFIGHGLKPFAVGSPFDPSALQLIKRLSREEIVSGIYRIPMDVFGSGDQQSSGVTIGAQTMEPAREMFLVNVIIPWAKWYDQQVNKDLAWRFDARHEAQHDFTHHPVLENRRLERAKVAATLIDRGVLLNDVIAWLDLALGAQPYGDEWWIENWRIPAGVVKKHADTVYQQTFETYRKQATDDHVRQIATLAQQTDVQAAAADAERERLKGRLPDNGTRIRELVTCLE